MRDWGIDRFWSGIAAAETPVERGKYLVETIAGCGNCHTPRGPGGVFAAGKELAGGFVFDEKPFRAVASNITPDKETGSATRPMPRSPRRSAKASAPTAR